MSEYLTPEEVAALLKTTPRIVSEWLEANEIPGIKIGNIWRVPKTKLEEWIESKTLIPQIKQPIVRVDIIQEPEVICSDENFRAIFENTNWDGVLRLCVLCILPAYTINEFIEE